MAFNKLLSSLLLSFALLASSCGGGSSSQSSSKATSSETSTVTESSIVESSKSEESSSIEEATSENSEDSIEISSEKSSLAESSSVEAEESSEEIISSIIEESEASSSEDSSSEESIEESSEEESIIESSEESEESSESGLSIEVESSSEEESSAEEESSSEVESSETPITGEIVVKIDGEVSNVSPEEDPGDNKAVYIIHLIKDQTLEFEIDGEALGFYIYNEELKQAILQSRSIVCGKDGTYTCYINQSNEVYISYEADPDEGYFYLNLTIDISWWENDGALTYVYYWSDTNTSMVSWPGVKASKKEEKKYKATLPVEATKVIIARVNATASNVDNQTNDLSLTGYNLTITESNLKA